MQPSTDFIGQLLNNRYKIVALLGTGSSANVYLAHDTTLERSVAVKLLQPELVNDEAFLTHFRAEARAVAALNHPNVLRVFDWGEQEGVPYLVMEYLGGGSLKDIMAQGVRLSPEQAATVGEQAASGVSYAHVRGLVHRDVKPENLLFDDEGRVRITDFGVARALAETNVSEPGDALLSAVRYASPEQAEGRPVESKADVYSLGLVLYESMTGVVPFLAETPQATLSARVGRTLPLNDAVGPLEAILIQATAPDPQDRLDAPTLEQRLASMQATLPPPLPLPLRNSNPPAQDQATGVLGATATGAALGSFGFKAPSLDELTQVTPAVTGSGHVPAGVSAPVRETVVVPVAEISDDSTTLAPRPIDPANYEMATRKRRKKWPFVLVAIVVLLGAFAAFAIGTKLFVPSVNVPSVVGESQSQARSTLSSKNLDAVFAPAVYSVSVPTGNIISQNPKSGASLKEGSSVTLTASRGLPPVTVPSLSGKTCEQAQAALVAVHLKGTCPDSSAAFSPTVPVNQVVNYTQGTTNNPPAVPYGSTVEIVISKGPPPIAIPQVSGTYDQAQATLSAAGFVAAQANEYSTTVATGQVIRTAPTAGSLAQKGSTVTVYVSLGKATTVPSVVGQTYAAATATLKASGLLAGMGTGPTTGRVVTSVPAAGSSVASGSTITLNLK